MAKKFDPKAKAKRQKIIVAVGSVALLALLAFQVPRTLKMLHQSSADSGSSSSSPSTSSTTTGPIAPPSLGGANTTPTAAAVSADGLSDPDSVPTPQSGQLLVFGRFRSKDPFSQQLAQCKAADGDTIPCPSTSGSSTTTTATAPANAPPTGGATVVQGSTPPAPPPPAAKRSAARISVNGVPESVQVGSQFPAANPTFTLVSVSAGTAKVGIAGGSFATGGQTVTLKKNKPLTLMNTADGTRYVLRLLSVS
jgi:hypothetical protein